MKVKVSGVFKSLNTDTQREAFIKEHDGTYKGKDITVYVIQGVGMDVQKKSILGNIRETYNSKGQKE